jgi:hypothetical protein
LTTNNHRARVLTLYHTFRRLSYPFRLPTTTQHPFRPLSYPFRPLSTHFEPEHTFRPLSYPFRPPTTLQRTFRHPNTRFQPSLTLSGTPRSRNACTSNCTRLSFFFCFVFFFLCTPGTRVCVFLGFLIYIIPVYFFIYMLMYVRHIIY